MARVELSASGQFRDEADARPPANSQQLPGISMIPGRACGFWLCVSIPERSEWLASGDMEAGRMPLVFCSH